jgi:aerobic-type carbon monoxide dehydrogenase small subunit (CoxS/CutS family)
MDTGRVRALRYSSTSWAGRVVNPALAQLQNDGNVIFGLGPTLMEELGLVGAKEGCGIGMCGAFTALIDGKATSGCLTVAAQRDGKEITTIEGLARDGELHPVQRAFIDNAAFQCAYCTPGFVLSTVPF